MSEPKVDRTSIPYLEVKTMEVAIYVKSQNGISVALEKLMNKTNQFLYEEVGWQIVGNPYVLGNSVYRDFIRQVIESPPDDGDSQPHIIESPDEADDA